MSYLCRFKVSSYFVATLLFACFQDTYADLPAHCLAGSASYSGNLPTWSQVKANNTGYIEPVPSNDIVGVPDLDNIGDEFPLSDSIENGVNMVSNLLNAKVLPTIASTILDPGTTGIAICAQTPSQSDINNGVIPITATLPITFCEFASACPSEGDRILWIPQSADFLQQLDVDVTVAGVTEEVDLFELLSKVSSGASLPAGISVSGSTNQVTFGAKVPVGFSDASKKWTKKVVEFLDEVFSMSLADILGPGSTSALSQLKKKIGKLTDAIDDFTKQVNLYGEGYHLGGMDNTRPKLHSCVGYYGHGVRSELASMLDGKIVIASRYKSKEISKDYKAQARLGLTEIELFGKELVLMAAPEANIQFDSLASFDCVAPFGIPMFSSASATIRNGLCPRTVSTPFEQVCNAGSSEEYAAIPQTNPAGSGAGFSGMVDYYPIDIGNGVVWPRFGDSPVDVANSNQSAYLQLKNNLLYFDSDGDPSTPDVNEQGPQTDVNHSVLSAGLNWAYEGGFEEPKTILTLGPFAPTPITAELRLDLDWGLNWFHDSFYMRDRLKGALATSTSGTSIDVDDIFERPMHALQAEDLTAENGNKYYIDPALILAAGVSFKLPKTPKKPKIFIDIGLELGFYPHAEVGFASGIADTGQAVKDALVNSGSNPDLPCEAITQNVDGPKSCSGNIHDMSEAAITGRAIKAATKTINTNVSLGGNSANTANIQVQTEKIITLSDYNDATNNGAITAMYVYDCGARGSSEISIYEDDEVTPVLTSSGEQRKVTLLIYSCESRGSCTVTSNLLNGDSVQLPGGQSAGSCDKLNNENNSSTFLPYQCTGLSRPEVTGWSGPGCSPLVEEAGYPTAPGGSCSVSADCGSGFACGQGACLVQCSSDAQCGGAESCGIGSNGQVCELTSGAPFAEQVAWRAANPDPAEPLHAVWTHAISEAGADIRFGAGLNLRAILKIFGKKITLIDKEWDKYWKLASSHVLKYQQGFEAEYNNECSPAGDVKNYQPSQIPRPLAELGINEVQGPVVSSEEFIERCEADIKGRVEEPDDDISAGALGDSVTDAATFSEDVALEMWNTYQGEMCINGIPYQDFIGGNMNEDQAGTLFLTGSDGSVTLLDENTDITVANSSGCLDTNASYTGVSQSYFNSLPRSSGRIDIEAMLLDVDGELEPSNFKPQYYFTHFIDAHRWSDGVAQCIENYVSNTDFEVGNFEVGPCDTPVADDNPKGDADGDSIENYRDNCPYTFNPRQLDRDKDGIGDACDNCPTTYNPDQLDSNEDGEGNACEIKPDYDFGHLVFAEAVAHVHDFFVIDDEVDDEDLPGGYPGVVVVAGPAVLPDLIVRNGFLDLQGHDLVVNGDLRITKGRLVLNGGSLTVKGSLIIENDKRGLDGSFASDGLLVMNNPKDSLVVGGDFIVNSHHSSENFLTAGTMEVKGHFSQVSNSETSSELATKNFFSSGDHKVILSGTEEQHVYFADSGVGSSHFNELILKNTGKVIFNSNVVVAKAFVDSGEGYEAKGVIDLPKDGDLDGVNDSLDTDLDNDGMPNVWELKYGLDPSDAEDAGKDNDADNVTNLDEYIANTNPLLADTDLDGKKDDVDEVVGLGLWGYACNIVHTPVGNRRWGINRYDLSEVTAATVESVFGVSKNRKIQSVACEQSGHSVLFSLQENQGSDYEIYELNPDTASLQQLTTNNTDDVDVTQSSDGLITAWQMRLSDGRQAIELRQRGLDGEVKTTTLASATPFVQPSLSANGQWLTFVQLRESFFTVMRYDVSAGTYLEVYSIARRQKLYNPSISNDGNLVGWSENASQTRYQVRDIEAGKTLELLTNDSGIEHAMLSGDGKTLVYSVNREDKRQTFLMTLETKSVIRLGSVLRDPNRYVANTWLGGSVGRRFTKDDIGGHRFVLDGGGRYTFNENGAGSYTDATSEESSINWSINESTGVLIVADSLGAKTIYRLLGIAGTRYAVSVIAPDGLGGVSRNIGFLYGDD